MSDERKATSHLHFTDLRGREVTREIRHTLDIRDFIGTPGYSALVVAANTHLSAADVALFLEVQSAKHPCVKRSRGWVQKRRWNYQQPGTRNARGSEPDIDGKQSLALTIMAQHSKESVRDLVLRLQERGITRSREWVRKHRCDLPPVSP